MKNLTWKSNLTERTNMTINFIPAPQGRRKWLPVQWSFIVFLQLILQPNGWARNCSDKCPGGIYRNFRICYFDAEKAPTSSLDRGNWIERTTSGCKYRRSSDGSEVSIISLFVQDAADAKKQTEEKLIRTLGPCDRITQIVFAQQPESYFKEGARRHAIQQMGSSILGTSKQYRSAFDSKLIQCSLSDELNVVLRDTEYMSGCKGSMAAINAVSNISKDKVVVLTESNSNKEPILKKSQSGVLAFSPSKSATENDNLSKTYQCKNNCFNTLRATEWAKIQVSGSLEGLEDSDSKKYFNQYCSDKSLSRRQFVEEKVRSTNQIFQNCLDSQSPNPSLTALANMSDTLFNAFDFVENLEANIKQLCTAEPPATQTRKPQAPKKTGSLY